MDGWMDGRTDGRMDRQTDRQMDVHLSGKFSLVACHVKAKFCHININFME